MIRVYDNETNALVGEITEEQLKFLEDQLEEESSEDQDYYLNTETIDLLETASAPPELIALLRRALGTRTEAEIRWQRE